MAIQIPELLVRDIQQTEKTPGILHGISILIQVSEPGKNRPAGVGGKLLKLVERHFLAGFGVQQRMAVQIYNRHLHILRRRHLVDRAVPGHFIIAVVGRV